MQTDWTLPPSVLRPPFRGTGISCVAHRSVCSPGINPHTRNIQSWITENDRDGNGKFTLCYLSVPGQGRSYLQWCSLFSPPSPMQCSPRSLGQRLVSVSPPGGCSQCTCQQVSSAEEEGKSMWALYKGKTFPIPLLSSKGKTYFSILWVARDKWKVFKTWDSRSQFYPRV